MADTFLTSQQQGFLDFFRKQPSLIDLFYFTGGTCLSEYYLHHRFSEDLDFFSEKEIDPQSITAILTKHKLELGYFRMDFQQSLNRNLFFLKYDKNKLLKIEFTYFPFTRIDDSQFKNKIAIDSLKDISVNKIFTIYQKPRGRDFYDLYAINRKFPFDFNELLKLARIKFDTHIDPLQLGRNIMQVNLLHDDPLVIGQVYDYKEVIYYFSNLALSLKNRVLD